MCVCVCVSFSIVQHTQFRRRDKTNYVDVKQEARSTLRYATLYASWHTDTLLLQSLIATSVLFFFFLIQNI